MKSEKDLAQELGIDRKLLRSMRAEGLEGWEKQGNTVVWAPEGEHKVRNRIQAQICAEELSEPLEVPEVQELVITKLPLNPKLVICGDIYVRVHSNRNFLTGMKVRARQSVTGDRVWVIVGRSPRWRGKY